MYKNILKIRELLTNSRKNFVCHLSSSRAFKHCEKLKLPLMILLIMRGLTRSLQIELVDCFGQIELLEELPSKSAFSQSRKKINWDLFKSLNKQICEIGYDQSKQLSSVYREFSPSNLRRVAVDGTTLTLPQLEELGAHFGYVKNQHSKQVLARCCIAYDIDTDQIIEANIKGYNVSEKAIATPFIANFGCSDLLIYDQYYYGAEFCFLHLKQGCHFLMRVYREKSNAIKEFVDSKKTDQIVEVKLTYKAFKSLEAKGYDVKRNDTMKLRFTKGWDDEQNEVYYVSNLIDEQAFKVEYLNESYDGRWSAETSIDVVKNKIQVECFAGHTVQAIQQEFHAAICQYNIVAMTYRQANDELYKEHPDKKEKYQVNRNLAVGLVRLSFFRLFADQKHDGSKQWKTIINILIRFPEPIRPGRSYKRKYTVNKSKGKYYTHTNYRRAA